MAERLYNIVIVHGGHNNSRHAVCWHNIQYEKTGTWKRTCLKIRKHYPAVWWVDVYFKRAHPDPKRDLVRHYKKEEICYQAR